MPVSRAAAILSPLAVAGALFGLSRLDPVTRVAPVLGLLRGPSGWLLLALVLGIVVSRGLKLFLPISKNPLPVLI